jgi:hypothetical protein
VVDNLVQSVSVSARVVARLTDRRLGVRVAQLVDVTKVCVVDFLLGAAFATGVALLVWWCVRWRA